MRHEKEWYTCDRCESEIEMMPQSFIERDFARNCKVMEESRKAFDK